MSTLHIPPSVITRGERDTIAKNCRSLPCLRIESLFSIPPIVGIVSDIFTRKQITLEEAISTLWLSEIIEARADD